MNARDPGRMVREREHAIYMLVRGLSNEDFKTIYLSPPDQPRHIGYFLARCIRRAGTPSPNLPPSGIVSENYFKAWHWDE